MKIKVVSTQYHLEPESDLDRLLLNTMEKDNLLNGFGRDPKTWDVFHAQIDRNLPLELQWFHEKIGGMKFENASAIVESMGFKLRKVKIDGKGQVITLDVNTRRINVEVQDDVITVVESFG